MQRSSVRLTVLLALGATIGQSAAPGVAAAPPKHERSAAKQERSLVEPGQPPHAWLFGTWTGGLFPVPGILSPQACLSQPVVIFTRDVVLRATLTSELYIQRVIES